MPDQKKKPANKRPSNSYLKYSGMVFQLFVLLLIAGWGGGKIDAYLGNETPYITALLLIVFFAAYMYKLYIDLTKDNE
jgi:hypothetical protein